MVSKVVKVVNAEGIYCLGDVYKEYDEENPDHPWNGSIPANYNQLNA